MTTLEFTLEISSGDGDTYRVRARAPGGEATATVRLPAALAELDHQLAAARDAVLASPVVVGRASSTGERPVQELGRQLFKALITDEVQNLYLASSRRAREQGGVLRLGLRVDPPELAGLPWEFLFNPGRQEYLGLTFPLARCVDMVALRQPVPLRVPVRILGMVARPDGPHSRKVGEEQRRLRAALAGPARDGLVELSWIAGQSYRDLVDALTLGPWHALHFVGHGGDDQHAGLGTLAFASETGGADLVGADDVSRLLAAHPTLRLVVLQADDTGRGTTLSGVAAVLVRQGIPAVVAMPGQITDQAVIVFAQTFYKNVAKGPTVDTAVLRARQALRLVKRDTLEWGTPALYLGAPDGRIVDTVAWPPPPGPAHGVRAPQRHHETSAGYRTERRATPLPAPDDLLEPIWHPRVVQTVQHDEAVTAVEFSADGRWLATASHDETARTWDATSGQETLRVQHKGLWPNVRGRPVNVRGRAVRGLALSPDGRLLATASDDYTARVWDATCGQQLVRFTHDNAVLGVAFSPDGLRLATASDDHTVRIWSITSAKRLATLTHDDQVYGVAFSPDGTRLVTVSGDATARIWGANSATILATIGHDKAVLGVAFSPDGRLLATACDDHTARIWDAGNAAQLLTLPHGKRVWAVTFSPDGHQLATACDDFTARIWGAGSGTTLAILPHHGQVYGVAYSPDGHRLATASQDRITRIWSLPDSSE